MRYAPRNQICSGVSDNYTVSRMLSAVSSGTRGGAACLPTLAVFARRRPRLSLLHIRAPTHTSLVPLMYTNPSTNTLFIVNK